MSFLKVTLRLVGTSLVALLLCVAAYPQGGDVGSITGAITDQTGGAISGATVTITDTQRGVTRTLTTDAAGQYNAPNLTPGDYTVRAEYTGFQAIERKNIQIEVGQQLRIDLVMQPGEQTQTITVSESVPLVDTTNATLGGTISNQLMGDLPVQGRNFQKLLELRPGVYLAPGSGKWSQSSNGMRTEHNVYILDGIDTIEGFSSQSVLNATPIFGDATSILPIDAIQEFQTEEIPKAEYGWKPGAIVNVGLKSGTNEVHGTAYAFGRDSAFDATNPFITPGSPKQETAIEDFGGTVGGPIKKDKLFYLFGYEGQRNTIGAPTGGLSLPTTADLEAQGVSVATAVTQSVLDACKALPAATPPKDLSLAMAGLTYAGPGNCGLNSSNVGVFQNRNTVRYSIAPVGNATLDNGLAKIDYHLNDKHTFSGEYFIGNYVGLGPQNAAAAQPYWDTYTAARSEVLGVHWLWAPNSTIVNEARWGLNRENQQSYPGDCNAIGQPSYSYLANFDANSVTTGAGLPANCGFPAITITGYAATGCCSSFPKIQGPDWTTQFVDNLSYIRGRHTFKFGYEMRYVLYNGGTYGGTRGSLTFSTLENFLTGTVASSPLPAELVGNTARSITEWGYAGFAQDDWRLTNRVTLNLGLRYETVTPMHDANGNLGNFDPNTPSGLVQESQVGNLWSRTNNWSPRVGFAWDIFGNSKWVVRGGGSIIYVLEGYNVFVSQQGVPGVLAGGLNTIPTGALLNGAPGPGTMKIATAQFQPAQINWTIAGPVFPSVSTIRCDSPLGTSPNNNPCPIFAVPSNLKRPYAPAWNLSLQHAFTNDLSLQVAYVGTHGTGLMGLDDINTPAPGSGWETFAGGTCSPIAPANILTAKVNTTCENLSRPYFSKFPYLSQIIEINNQDFSNYNALQVTLTQRQWHGLNYLVGYTWAHSLDESGADWNGATLPSDLYDVRQDYGSAANDVRQRITASISYALPNKQGHAQMLEGWRLNAVANVQSALPWSSIDATDDISGIGGKQDRWDFAGDPSAFSGLGSGTVPYFTGLTNAACTAKAAALDASYTPLHPGYTYTNALAKYGCYDLNGAMMLPPAFGLYGDAGRDIFRERGLKLLDMSLTKDVKFTERLAGQFRFEVFNILNKAQFSVPSTTTGSPAGGNVNFAASPATPDVQVSNPEVGSGAARSIQLGFRMTF
jgi:hypothetical protein